MFEKNSEHYLLLSLTNGGKKEILTSDNFDRHTTDY